MRRILLLFLILTMKLGVCQVDSSNPYDYLNEKNQPALLTQQTIAKNQIKELVIRHFTRDEYDSTKFRTRLYKRIVFEQDGLIKHIEAYDSAQVYYKSKENIWGKAMMALGQRRNMVFTEKYWFYYCYDELLDSSFYWSQDYLSTKSHHEECVNFYYDDYGRLIFQRNVNRYLSEDKNGYRDTNIETYKMTYQGLSTQIDTMYLFKEDWGSADLYDTIIGTPKTLYHIGYIPDKIELGDNGFVQRITKERRIYQAPSKNDKQVNPQSTAIIYLVFHYNEKDRIESISHRNFDSKQIGEEKFIYDESGLILQKNWIEGEKENVLVSYSYEKY